MSINICTIVLFPNAVMANNYHHPGNFEKKRWAKKGPKLPYPIEAAQMIDYNNGVILIGGKSDGYNGDKLFRLSSTKGPWKEMTHTLKQGLSL